MIVNYLSLLIYLLHFGGFVQFDLPAVEIGRRTSHQILHDLIAINSNHRLILSELFYLRVSSDRAVMWLSDNIILGVEANRLHKLNAVMLAILPKMIVNIAHL